MKKYFLLLLFSVFIISCSKKEVIISGKIYNASPLSRIEVIDIASIDTLPIANFGIDKNGNFADTLKIEKDGVYAIIYEGRANFIYLQKGKNIHLTGNSFTFPKDIKITGEGQGNNEFLMESQKITNEYLSKFNVKVFEKNEADFIKEMEKYATDINKKLDEIAKTKKADSNVVKWKKNDLIVNLLMNSFQYELMHGRITNKPDFKVSEKFKEQRKKIEKESFVKEYPAYRQYIISKLQEDFRKFVLSNIRDTKLSRTEVFTKFLETRKELSQETKDYLISFVATQFDLHPRSEKAEQVMQVIEEKVKNKAVKKDLEKVYTTIIGLKLGTDTPEVSLIQQDGKSTNLSNFKGKPSLLVFYSSFAPNMIEEVLPLLKEINEFYKDKLNFVYINLDDNTQQFQKTSKALMKDLKGVNVYSKGGLKSDVAEKFHIYGFKLPSFVVLDKDGKIASKSILHLASPELIEVLNKQTGLNLEIPAEESLQDERE
ncbi:MAG: thioredoxin-like domain-containing protein [Flavobacteriaceae bacterium]|nr:thioredoxin-like domain-containing protein [Flavobacteriaceae bacterium]